MGALHPFSLLFPLMALALSPLLMGVINRTKAAWAGRTGQPLTQMYFDLARLWRKGAVYSRTTTWVFRMGPVAGLASALAALTLTPFGGLPAALSFDGDLLALIYLIGAGRFFTILAALDTGSAFEGMGASREAFFAVFTEVIFILGLAALAMQTGSLSLSGMVATSEKFDFAASAMVAAALFVALLAENARIPVDDPNTHLELTMIHEVMVLDHGGPDLALIEYSRALKWWLFSSILAQALTPLPGGPGLAVVYTLTMMTALAIAAGVVESTMARLRLTFVPPFLMGAGALSALAVILFLR